MYILYTKDKCNIVRKNGFMKIHIGRYKIGSSIYYSQTVSAYYKILID